MNRKRKHPARFNNPIRRRLLGLLEQHFIPELAEIISDYEGEGDFKMIDRAARQGDGLAVELCFRGGVDVNEVVHAYNWGTPLNAACRHGHATLAKWLVEEAGALVNQEDAQGRTSLHAACRNGDLTLAKWLVAAGALVNSKKLLHAACLNGHLAVAQWLVGCGADVNMVNQHGWSPLMRACAAEVDDLSMVQWLVTEARANVHMTSTEGVNFLCPYNNGVPMGATALDIATIEYNYAMVEFLGPFFPTVPAS